MRLVFAGTPAFAATALGSLIAAGHDIVLVLTQPDRPAGRGLKVEATPVKAVALAHGVGVLQPAGLRLDGRHAADARDAHDRLRGTPHDAMIVAAYGLILPATVLAIPRLGCLNIHASLLPRWRGAAPIQRAIEAGDVDTGITIMQMDEGLDTGPMLLVRRTAIGATETAGELTRRLAVLGGEAIVDALRVAEAGRLPSRARPQDAAGATYAAKLARSEAALDFDRPSRELLDRIRAFDPWPGCTAALESTATTEPYKVWQARPAPPSVERSGALAGRVVGFQEAGTAELPGGGVFVATGDGVIALTQLQRAGGKRLDARLFAQDFGRSPAAG